MGDFVTTIGQTTANPLGAKVSAALQQAVANEGKLPTELLDLAGMSGRKYRLFINNLIASLDDARYLEVGVFTGSTLCSAINGNKVTAVAIDNWSQFGGPMGQFLVNLSRFKTAAAHVSFLESDFRAVDFGSLGQFNVYLFDGPHHRDGQYDGIALALRALDDHCILIIDDWNWPLVREGTLASIRAVGMVVDYLVEIRTTMDGQHGPIAGARSDWHNGYFIAALSKHGA
jgi:SAM-dependent methyltransferase